MQKRINVMKRIFTLLLSLIMILSLSSCNSYDLSGLSEYEKIAVQNAATLKDKVNSDSFNLLSDNYIYVGKKSDVDNFYITLMPYFDANKEVDVAIFKNNKFIMNRSETKNLDGNIRKDTELEEILLFSSLGFPEQAHGNGYDVKRVSTNIIKERLNLK